MIIGISGTFGAGKDLVAKYLETEKGFQHFSLADILREIAVENGTGVDRESVRILANKLNEEEGGDFLAKRALKRKNRENLVISAVRRPEEIDFLKHQDDFILFFIDAPIEIRYKRMVSRSRDVEGKMTLDELRDKEELEGSGKSSQRVDLCKEKADFIINNSGTEDELRKKIDKILKECCDTVR
ncbi:MAG: AAA family ATPase [Patescibacteria group bacterium]|nr:AAA family ATPase [Patescibacteria group bacterium]